MLARDCVVHLRSLYNCNVTKWVALLFTSSVVSANVVNAEIFDCSDESFDNQISRSDLVVIAHVAAGSARKENGDFELVSYRIWKGSRTRFLYRPNGYGPNYFSKGDFYLMFLNRLPGEDVYSKQACRYSDYVDFSGEILEKLGEPSWVYGQ